MSERSSGDLDKLERVTIHTDGGCNPNPGPGGWACVLTSGPYRKELKGGELATTNNRMELMAAVQALNALRKPCSVDLFTDSEYLQQGVTAWMPRWKENGWRRRVRRRWKPVKNEDLWRSIDKAASQHTIKWHWIPAHSGHTENEWCDKLVAQEIERIRAKYSPAELERALSEFEQMQD